MYLVLDGKKVSESRAERLHDAISSMKNKPTLAIIQIGDLETSNSYIRHKKAFAEKIGATVKHVKYPETVTEKELLAAISLCNSDTSIQGIIVQLPIPKHLDKNKIIESINPAKDVDGLTSENIKSLFHNKKGIVPATAKGIVTLLEYYQIDPTGKNVVVVGRSSLVGKPTALALSNKNATVTICHSRTKDLAAETKRAEILIVAAGHPGLITADHVSKGQIVIDVGLTITKDKKAVGDVDFENVKNIVGAISPVPGGVGPMTIVSLFENLVETCK